MSTPLVHHVSVSVRDFPKNRELYKGLMELLGREVFLDIPGQYIGFDNCAFGVGKSKLDHPQSIHVAFAATSNDQVDEFYNKAISLGATCNGKPGYRPEYTPTYYAAFFHDFEGNNVEIVHIGCPEEYNYNDKK